MEVIKQFVIDDNLEERKKCSNNIRSRCKKLRYQEKQRGEIGEPEQSCSKENRIIIYLYCAFSIKILKNTRINLWGASFINLAFIHFKSFFLIKQKKMLLVVRRTETANIFG